MGRTIGIGDGCWLVVALSRMVPLVMGRWQWVVGSSVIDGERRPQVREKKNEMKKKEKRNKEKRKSGEKEREWIKRIWRKMWVKRLSWVDMKREMRSLGFCLKWVMGIWWKKRRAKINSPIKLGLKVKKNKPNKY